MASRSQLRASAGQHLPFLITSVILVGILYVGKPVLVPLALAILLAFILTPMVQAVQRRGLKRVPAVLLVVVASLLVCGEIGWGVGRQVMKLAEDLPAHADEVKAKVSNLQSSGAGPISRLLNAFQGVGEKAADTVKAEETAAEHPVVVAPPQSSAIERLLAVASAVLEPVASTGLILILVIFMLINREDLRNRVIGLLGHGRLTGTTRVFVESAERISRLLLLQLAVNASIGLLFGVSLLIIGVPYWLLWGFLTVVLRFVPYIGSWMAAGLPVLLSFAISPGWGQPLLVLGIFAVLDLVTANAIEPMLFGHSTGVSPVALLVAAVFWTWIWGPIGLVLSTPLTVCLVVLGQYVPRLRFLSLLLGDQPALEPHLAYYQRLLAGDQSEASQIAKNHAKVHGLEHVADDVLVPALRLARRDREQAGLTHEDETLIFESTRTILQQLANDAVPAPEESPPLAPPTALILGCPAHHVAEELTLDMLADLLRPVCRFEVVSTRELPAEIEEQVESERPALVFIAILPPGGITQARYLCKRLHKRFPDLKIIVGYFGRVRNFDRLLVRLRASGASYVNTSILQCQSQLRSLLPHEPSVTALLTGPVPQVDGTPPTSGAASTSGGASTGSAAVTGAGQSAAKSTTH